MFRISTETLMAELAECYRMLATTYDGIASRQYGIPTEGDIAEQRHIERKIRALCVLLKG